MDRIVGNIYYGRVEAVLPGMQAAFVDIGLEKAAFLYAGDYYDDSIRANGDNEAPQRSRGRSRNGSRPPPPNIDALLHEGQEIVVQVAKEPIGSKGARITSHISIAGRHLVVTPLSQRFAGLIDRVTSSRSTSNREYTTISIYRLTIDDSRFM